MKIDSQNVKKDISCIFTRLVNVYHNQLFAKFSVKCQRFLLKFGKNIPAEIQETLDSY